ncbi:MAG: type II secretion system F family protein [Chloroflexi bacterium]|nr:MAG: type II secretion system F family protein [Chloroflexota bacterium]TMD52562.1 MAG: type II secretion system F family protein [Chloroflexota bacterium]
MSSLMGTTVAAFLGLCAGGGVIAMLVGLRPAPPTDADIVETRLRLYGGSMPVSLAELELAAPLSQRILMPTLHRIGRFLDKLMPANVQQDLHRKMMLASRPLGLSAADFNALRWVLTVFLGLVGLGVGALTQNPIVAAGSATLGTVLGLYLPILWLNRLVRRRQRDLQGALPDAMDLLTVTVEAGLGFDAAMARVAEKYENPLASEFARVLLEVRLGRPRLEALDDMGRRCGVEDLHNFVQAVIQSEQMGSTIAKILHVQSDEIRRKRFQKAQERGAQASLKMLLPMIGCIFPSLWVILLGPAAVIVSEALSKK